MAVMDRLAFSTLGCPEWDFETILARAPEMGFSAIEIRGIGPELNTAKIPCLLPENRAETKAHLAARGLQVAVIGTSAIFHDAARVDASIAEGKEALPIANDMGACGIRVFGDSFPEGETHDSVLDRVAQSIRMLGEAALSAGRAEVLLEIHGQYNTPEVLSALLDRLEGCPRFGIIWDVQHSFRSMGRDFAPFLRVIRPFIRHVHLKDCRMVNGKDTPCMPGDGEINIAEIVRALEADGYQGYYSFEWEKRWHAALEAPEAAFPRFVEVMRNI